MADNEKQPIVAQETRDNAVLSIDEVRYSMLIIFLHFSQPAFVTGAPAVADLRIKRASFG